MGFRVWGLGLSKGLGGQGFMLRGVGVEGLVRADGLAPRILVPFRGSSRFVWEKSNHHIF